VLRDEHDPVVLLLKLVELPPPFNWVPSLGSAAAEQRYVVEWIKGRNDSLGNRVAVHTLN
jgi:hypothetical protein